MLGSNRSVTLLLFLFMSSCQQSELSATEFKKWMDTSEELNKKKDMGDYTYKIKLVPNQWVAYLNMKNNRDSEEFEIRKNDGLGMLYFNLEIDVKSGKQNALKNGLKNEEDYYNRLYYVSYKMKDDIEMNFADSSYQCKLYVYERAYDLNTKLSFMLGFERPGKLAEEVIISIRPQFFSDDRVNFSFSKKAIQATPKLLI